MRLCIFGLLLLPLTGLTARADYIAGSSIGYFLNPLPGGTYSTGIGTNSMTFGDPTGFATGPNRLSFIGTSFFGTFTETDFLIGQLYFFNGTVRNDPPPPTSVDFRAQLYLMGPTPATVNSDFRLKLIGTPNTGTPDQNADSVVFPTSFSTTTFNVNSTTYTLELLGFRNIVGDGFVTSNSYQLNVREGLSATADLYGRITANIPPPVPPQPVSAPAPSGFVLTGIALLCASLQTAFRQFWNRYFVSSGDKQLGTLPA